MLSAFDTRKPGELADNVQFTSIEAVAQLLQCFGIPRSSTGRFRIEAFMNFRCAHQGALSLPGCVIIEWPQSNIHIPRTDLIKQEYFPLHFNTKLQTYRYDPIEHCLCIRGIRSASYDVYTVCIQPKLVEAVKVNSGGADMLATSLPSADDDE